jgi:hypothetical protein
MAFLRKVLLFSLLLVSVISKAQFKWEFGGLIGPANYLGEIGGYDKDARPTIYDLKLKSTRYSLGAFAKNKYRSWLAVRYSLCWIRISAADNLSAIPGRVGRNLSFRNDMFELAVQPEFFFFQAQDFMSIGRNRVDFRAYMTAGVAGYYSDPKANLGSIWYSLQKYKTEGQLTPYSKFGVAIPLGIGMDYTIGRKTRIGLEFSWRYTFSDYLDDVSTVYADPSSFENDEIGKKLSNRRGEITNNDPKVVASPDQYLPGQKRGNPNANDSYLLVSVSYGYVLKGKSSFYRSRYNYLTSAKRKFKRRRVRAKF